MTQIEERRSDRPALLIVAIVLGGFLSLYNSVAMNVAIPTFVRVFHADLGMVQWIMISYTLMMGVLAPTSGFFADKFSCRNLFGFSMVGIAVTAFISGCCNNIYQMIAIRLVQGMLSAFIVPCSMMIIYQFIPYSKRSMFLTLQTVSMSMGPAVGPVISGLLLTCTVWRWVFWINIPIALVTAWAIFRAVPYEVHETGERLDYAGFAFVILGTVLFLLSFNQVSSWGFTSPAFLAILLTGIVLIGLFVRRCMKSEHPILNFHILSNTEFSAALLINSGISMALCLVPFVLAIYFQDIMGYTPLYSGVILLIPAVFSIAGGPIAQWLYSRVDSKIIIVAAMLFLAVGSLMLSHTLIETAMSVVVFWLCVRYLGIGLSSMPITDYGMSAIGREMSGHGSSLINWFKMMSTSLSLSVFTMVLSMRIAVHSAGNDLIHAQMYAIDDVFLYSALILFFCAAMAMLLKSGKNL